MGDDLRLGMTYSPFHFSFPATATDTELVPAKGHAYREIGKYEGLPPPHSLHFALPHARPSAGTNSLSVEAARGQKKIEQTHALWRCKREDTKPFKRTNVPSVPLSDRAKWVGDDWGIHHGPPDLSHYGHKTRNRRGTDSQLGKEINSGIPLIINSK